MVMPTLAHHYYLALHQWKLLLAHLYSILGAIQKTAKCCDSLEIEPR